MEPKFGRYIKFNGCLILLIVGFRVIVNAQQWVIQLQNWHEYPFPEDLEMRNHPVVDGVFQIMWIIAVTSFYQALWLEVGLLLYPIGFVLGLEAIIICAGDVIKRWNGDAEYCFLHSGQVGVLYFAALAYFYYTLYILKKLFRSEDRKFTTLPAPSGLAQRQPISPLVRVH
uniref:EXPERA domain-containing protein n=1 Tax=Anopheles maculatus TaxID=74869 RepID=A0A182T7C5_9DIPT